MEVDCLVRCCVYLLFPSITQRQTEILKVPIRERQKTVIMRRNSRARGAAGRRRGRWEKWIFSVFQNVGKLNRGVSGDFICVQNELLAHNIRGESHRLPFSKSGTRWEPTNRTMKHRIQGRSFLQFKITSRGWRWTATRWSLFLQGRSVLVLCYS